MRRREFLTRWCVGAGALIAFVPLGRAAPPTPFAAGFDLRSGGARVARTGWTLATAGPGRYVYESRTASAGLVSLFRREEIVERSELELHQGRLRPLRYRYDRTGGKREKRIRVDFDWTRREAEGVTSAGTSRVAIPEGATDRLSYLLALMRDLAAGRDDLAYAVADGNRLREYRLERRGESVVDTEVGALDTVAVRRVRAGGRRETTLWCAASLGFLPVAVQHRETDGGVLRLDLVSLEGRRP